MDASRRPGSDRPSGVVGYGTITGVPIRTRL
jgi:hypothetical protein